MVQSGKHGEGIWFTCGEDKPLENPKKGPLYSLPWERCVELQIWSQPMLYDGNEKRRAPRKYMPTKGPKENHGPRKSVDPTELDLQVTVIVALLD